MNTGESLFFYEFNLLFTGFPLLFPNLIHTVERQKNNRNENKLCNAALFPYSLAIYSYLEGLGKIRIYAW